MPIFPTDGFNPIDYESIPSDSSPELSCVSHLEQNPDVLKTLLIWIVGGVPCFVVVGVFLKLSVQAGSLSYYYAIVVATMLCAFTAKALFAHLLAHFLVDSGLESKFARINEPSWWGLLFGSAVARYAVPGISLVVLWFLLWVTRRNSYAQTSFDTSTPCYAFAASSFSLCFFVALLIFVCIQLAKPSVKESVFVWRLAIHAWLQRDLPTELPFAYKPFLRPRALRLAFLALPLMLLAISVPQSAAFFPVIPQASSSETQKAWIVSGIGAEKSESREGNAKAKWERLTRVAGWLPASFYFVQERPMLVAFSFLVSLFLSSAYIILIFSSIFLLYTAEAELFAVHLTTYLENKESRTATINELLLLSSDRYERESVYLGEIILPEEAI